MALVLSPWIGRGCGRRSTPRFGFGSPSLFTDFVIVKVPSQRQSCAPVERAAATASVRVVQWAETPEAHIFTLRLPGLKKEDLLIQVEDDRILYISHSNQPKEEAAKEGDAAAASTSQPQEQAPSSSCSFMRKFKLPETSDVEQIKAEVINETLTVTVPKRQTKTPEARKIDVSDDAGVVDPNTSTSQA
jgi:HSP20 family protein